VIIPAIIVTQVMGLYTRVNNLKLNKTIFHVLFNGFSSTQIYKKKKINSLSIVVPNLRYAHPWGYAADRLWVKENNIGNGGKHQKKGVKITTQKQSYEVLAYRERFM
jgi:hypothetical protein